MNHHQNMNGSGSGRMQWGSYGFLAGVLVGLLMGWMFHGFVGAVVRLGLAALIIIPLVLAVLAWKKFIAPMFRSTPERVYPPNPSSIEVRGVVREPRAR